MHKPTHLNRRRFLQGTGIALTLPAFESLSVRAAPDKSPRRLVCVGNHLGFYPGNFFPEDAGRNYTPTSTLKPLEPHRNDLTVFSHLDHGLNGGHKGVQGFLNSIKKEEAWAGEEHLPRPGCCRACRQRDAFPDQHGDRQRHGRVLDPRWRSRAAGQQSRHLVSRPLRRLAQKRTGGGMHAVEASRQCARRAARICERLEQDLNAADRDKLDQYLTSIRDVERRLQMSKEWLDRPKPESPIDEVVDEERQHIDEVALFYDLMALALQTDSTRVATLETGMGFRTSELDLGSYHGLSHHGKAPGRIDQLKVVEAFLTTKLSDFISRLKEARILDDTLIVFGSGMSDGSIHSNRNLPVILAGGGVKHKGHLVCPAGQHKALPNLWLSALQWFGAERERFGRSTERFHLWSWADDEIPSAFRMKSESGTETRIVHPFELLVSIWVFGCFVIIRRRDNAEIPNNFASAATARKSKRPTAVSTICLQNRERGRPRTLPGNHRPAEPCEHATGRRAPAVIRRAGPGDHPTDPETQDRPGRTQYFRRTQRPAPAQLVGIPAYNRRPAGAQCGRLESGRRFSGGGKGARLRQQWSQPGHLRKVDGSLLYRRRRSHSSSHRFNAIKERARSLFYFSAKRQ